MVLARAASWEVGVNVAPGRDEVDVHHELNKRRLARVVAADP